MTSSNFKVNFVEPMVHIYQREFRRTMFELYFICNFRDLPTHVRDVVESDIRDAVIKLCIGELDNQKRLEKAQSVIKIGKFLSKYCQFLTEMVNFLFRIGFFRQTALAYEEEILYSSWERIYG